MSDYSPARPADSAPTPTNTAAPLVAIYWLIVLAPLCWGVYQTVQKSIPLFHVTSTAAAAPPATLPTPTPSISPPTTAADAPLVNPVANATSTPATVATPTDSPAPMNLPTSTPL